MNKLVMVEWIDSVQPIPAWNFLENLPKIEPIRCKSVGWVVGETKDVLMLASNLGGTGGEYNQGCGLMQITKATIKRRRTLK